MMPLPETVVDSDSMLQEAVSALLKEPVTALERLAHTGNNQAFRVATAKGNYFAKWYFHSADDGRDRLQQEWHFLQFAQGVGIRHVPNPIAKDDSARVAIYSFLEGSKPQSLDKAMVQEAAALICALNAHSHTPEARALAAASESCFGAEAHIALLQARVEKLQQGAPLAEHKDAFETLRGKISQQLTLQAEMLRAGYATLGLDAASALAANERILSPSDFGFHNSLRDANGKLSFIDFEYAGWDDPAKMLADFFLHPGVRVDAAFVPDFWKGVREVLQEPERTRARAKLLYPLLGLKWCCIMLNVFIPEWAARRQFSDRAWEIGRAQAEQLEKARVLLYTLSHSPF